MDNASIAILESLQYKIPSIRNVYSLIDINVGSSLHKEVDNIVSNFTNPSVIISIGLLTNCYIIQRESKTKIHVICISQETIYFKCNTGELVRNIVGSLKLKDFVPDPIMKKIVFINDYNKTVTGEVFYEMNKDRYTNNKKAIYEFLDFDKDSLYNSNKIISDYIKEIKWQQ